MRICNLGHARSRSSLLIFHLQNYYNNLTNYNETYAQLKKKSYGKYSADQNLSLKDTQFANYSEKIFDFTNQIFSNSNNFIIKLWPRYMNCTNFVQEFDCFILNLNDCFKLNEYDKIYVTVREPVDTLCSYKLGQLYKFHYTDLQEFTYYNQKKKSNYENNIVLDNLENRSLITEIFLIDKICEYMDKKNIKYKLINYNDAPQYLERNYPIIGNDYKHFMPMDNQLRYSEIIKNYAEVQDWVKNFRKDIMPKINNLRLV